MKIYTIWAIEPSDPEAGPGVQDAWDEGTVGYNPEGWTEAVQKAVATFGGDNVRVLEISIPVKAVRDLWKVPVVKADRTKAVQLTDLELDMEHLRELREKQP